jgi:stage V sporulation protein B
MSQPDKAVGAGRGVLYIAIAKVYFIVAGFLLETLLPRLLGKALYGAYGVVVPWVSNLNNVIVTGTIQAVSRQTTADPARADEVKAAGLRMQLLVALPVAAAFALLAPLWAWIEHDPEKTGLLALSGGIVAFYALYTVFVGSANGTRQFHKQAGLDMTFATLRVGGVLGAAALGLGVWGAIEAWVAAAGLIFVIAALWVGFPRDLRAGAVAPMLRYFAGLALYLIVMNLIMSVDTFLLKRLITEWYGARPALGDPTTLADAQVAHYRVVQNLARLPYQLMIAVTFVVFPLVSRSVFENDAEKTRAYVRTTMRYSLVFAGLMGAVLAAESGPIIGLLYANDPSYASEGWLAAAILALGNVAFAVFTVAGTILNGAGRTDDAIRVAALTLVLLVTGLWLGIPHGAPGLEVLAICAAATSAAMALGAGASGWLLWQRFGAFLPPVSLVRVAAATAAAIGLGRVLVPHGKVMAVVHAGLAAVVYLAVIWVTGELGRADLAALRRRKG